MKIFKGLALPFLVFTFCYPASAQDGSISGWAGFSSSVSRGGTLPFWFTHNQNGKYTQQGGTYQLLETGFRGSYPLHSLARVDYGLDANISYSGKLVGQLNQLYLGIRCKRLVLRVGAFADPVLFAGLSSSNGSIIRSVNARPYPKIRLSTNGFIPAPFLKRSLSFKAEYDEGILFEPRVVKRPRLHHKSFFIRYSNSSGLRVEAGMNHYVFWGGISPVYGQLPDGIKDYFLYILGKPGNTDFPATDVNVAGNQLGDYSILVTKPVKGGVLKFYVSHPFEDHSGMEFDNLSDNLYGIGYFKDDPKSFFEGFIYEFLFTKQQSGGKHVVTGPKSSRMRGLDNYFNHGVYASGFTYRGFAMSSPLFFPLVINNEGVAAGFANNRVIAHHLGAKGNFSPGLQWKVLLTSTKNFGTYGSPFSPAKKQFLSYCEVKFAPDAKPVELSLSAGVDIGNLSGGRVGVMLNVVRIFRK
ncbi:MAG: capsule assembly Wzi family protein [Chlorobi bacterium]|nr:capsule assembly Wzi family protein [Chlorobiota bacterium]